MVSNSIQLALAGKPLISYGTRPRRGACSTYTTRWEAASARCALPRLIRFTSGTPENPPPAYFSYPLATGKAKTQAKRVLQALNETLTRVPTFYKALKLFRHQTLPAIESSASLRRASILLGKPGA